MMRNTTEKNYSKYKVKIILKVHYGMLLPSYVVNFYVMVILQNVMMIVYTYSMASNCCLNVWGEFLGNCCPKPNENGKSPRASPMIPRDS